MVHPVQNRYKSNVGSFTNNLAGKHRHNSALKALYDRFPIQKRQLFLSISLFLFVISCSESEMITKNVVEVTTKKALHSNAQFTISNNKILIKKNEHVYEIIIGKGAIGGKNKSQSSIPIVPGAKLISHVSGIATESFTFIHNNSIDEIEKFFNTVFNTRAGFEKLAALRGEKGYTSQWTAISDGLRISVYAFSNKDGSKYITLLQMKAKGV